jgi:hypothetical protein
MAAFTYLWTRDEYDLHRERGGDTFLCAGGNTFRDRGVRAADHLYIVSFFGGIGVGQKPGHFVGQNVGLVPPEHGFATSSLPL